MDLLFAAAQELISFCDLIEDFLEKKHLCRYEKQDIGQRIKQYKNEYS